MCPDEKTTNPDLCGRLQRINTTISQHAEKYQRQAKDITLLAVSKTSPAAAIKQLYECGQYAYGENYVDEALTKMEQLKDLDIEWHYIGPIQSNKTAKIASHFSWVHSLASLKHARRLNEQREDLPALNVCIQINISTEESKSGIPLKALPEFAAEISTLSRLKLRGIMGIPKAENELQQQRRVFAELANAQQELIQAGYTLDTLSMGMSGDIEAAIAEGSTLLRIGTAIFGPRAKR